MTQIADKVATIVPVQHLSAIRHHKRFMALVHLLKDDEYRTFYKHRVDENKWVILDNSTVELGEPYPLEPYIAEAVRLGASEILLPDWLHDRRLTLNAAYLGLKAVEAAGYRGQVMGVPQGKNVAEWVLCLRDMLNMGITSIGISRRYLDKFGESRLFACYTVLANALDLNVLDISVHLLGAGAPVEIEVAPCLKLYWVVGVDSAMPSYFAKAGMPIPFNAERPNVEIDFERDWYEPTLLYENIAAWRALCGAD